MQIAIVFNVSHNDTTNTNEPKLGKHKQLSIAHALTHAFPPKIYKVIDKKKKKKKFEWNHRPPTIPIKPTTRTTTTTTMTMTTTMK